LYLNDSSLAPSDECLAFIAEGPQENGINEHPKSTDPDQSSVDAYLKKFEQKFGWSTVCNTLSKSSLMNITGAVFVQEVWLGGRRSSIEKTLEHGRSTKQEDKHTTSTKGGLEAAGPGGINLSGRREAGKGSSQANESSTKERLASLRVIGGDEARGDE
jgi:hypothetical protein